MYNTKRIGYKRSACLWRINYWIILQESQWATNFRESKYAFRWFLCLYIYMYVYIYILVSDISLVSPGDDDCRNGDHRQADGQNKKKQRRNTTIMHVHVGRKKRHAVQPSVRCCLPANGTSPKYSSTLSVDMLLSDRETLDNDPLLASREPPAGNCNKSSSVSVSMSRDRRLYTCQQITPRYMHFSSLFFLFFSSKMTPDEIHYGHILMDGRILLCVRY